MVEADGGARAGADGGAGAAGDGQPDADLGEVGGVEHEVAERGPGELPRRRHLARLAHPCRRARCPSRSYIPLRPKLAISPQFSSNRRFSLQTVPHVRCTPSLLRRNSHKTISGHTCCPYSTALCFYATFESSESDSMHPPDLFLTLTVLHRCKRGL